MKSGLLFGLYAARALTESKAKGSFCIVYNSEEEIGSRHARSWIEELAKQSRTAVILEPARPNGNLMNERKGLGRIEVTFNGKAAHAGVEPEKGGAPLTKWPTDPGTSQPHGFRKGYHS